MNVKKYLKKKAEEDHRAIREADGGEFLRSLQTQVNNESTHKKRTIRHFRGWIAGAASAVVLALVVALSIFLPAQLSQISYLEENFVHLDSSIDELNTNMQLFSLHIDASQYNVDVRKTIDNVSGDVLFYWVDIHSIDALLHMEIVTVCNANFKYNDAHESKESEVIELPAYSLKYHTSKIIDDEFGLEMLTGFGEIQLGKEYVYITSYSEFLLSPDGQFLENIESIVKAVDTNS